MFSIVVTVVVYLGWEAAYVSDKLDIENLSSSVSS